MRRWLLILVVAALLAPIRGQNEDQESFGIDVVAFQTLFDVFKKFFFILTEYLW